MQITITLERTDTGQWFAIIEDWAESDLITLEDTISDAIISAAENHRDWLDQMADDIDPAQKSLW